MEIKEGDVVLVEFKWTKRVLFFKDSFSQIQRVVIKKVNENTFEGEYNVPERYEWKTELFEKSKIIEKITHGKDSSCCEDCAMAYDKCCIPDRVSALWNFGDKERESYKKKIESTFSST